MMALIFYIGKLTNEQCHLLSYTKKDLSLKVSDITPGELILFEMRIPNFDKNANDDICNHHYHKFGLLYSCLQKYCCDPFAKHKKRIDNNLSILELRHAKHLTALMKLS